ncbi:MAG: hypothetical protein IJC59_03255 [Lachnospiraceae bacterium]|nr:hypothetical protein [Lachnospiraceae bacterium]
MIIHKTNRTETYGVAGEQHLQEKGATAKEASENREQQAEAGSNTGQSSVIYAGSLNLPGDEIETKREQARDQARRLIDKVWAGEREVDEDLRERGEKIDSLLEEKHTCVDHILTLRKEREALRGQYGVDADSTEEQELRLLEKELDSINPLKDVSMTKEEYQEVLKIRAKGLTEYQERSLQKFSEMRKWELEEYKLERQVIQGNAEIRAIRLERLKHNPMAEAKVQAEEILREAGRDVIGMLAEDMKEHVDQAAREAQEEARERAEKEEEKEELGEGAAEKAGEERKRQQEILEGERKAAQTSMELAEAGSQIREEVGQLLHTMKLLEEDVKGLEVDELL